MRQILALTFAVVCAGCGDLATTPSSPRSATFTYRMAVCPIENAERMVQETPCAETGQVADSGGSFTLTVGTEYQFQLSVTHFRRQNNCRVFGNVSMTQSVSAHVLEFNWFEEQLPTPFYLGGIRFIPKVGGTYQVRIQATDGCDTPNGALAPVQIVTLVVR